MRVLFVTHAKLSVMGGCDMLYGIITQFSICTAFSWKLCICLFFLFANRQNANVMGEKRIPKHRERHTSLVPKMTKKKKNTLRENELFSLQQLGYVFI